MGNVDENTDTSPDKEEITVLSIPGLTIDLKHQNGFIKLEAKGHLRGICSPFLKKMNATLEAEKPALVEKDRVIASTWLPPIPSNVFKRLLFAETQIALGKYVPETVSFEITRNCNCNCDHCIMSEGEEEGDLDTATIKKAIDEALDMGAVVITFTEGDPLLREDIFELIEYVDKDKAIVNIYTPGTEMTAEVAQKLKEIGLHNLLISIYSTVPEEHDSVRKLEGAFEKATGAIKYGLDAGLLVTMCTHVSPKNMEKLESMYQFATELGVHEFSLWESVPKRPEDPIITDKDRDRIMEMYRRINASKDGPRIFANTYFEGEMLGCMAGQRWLHVCVEGSVKPCPYIPFSFGNIQTDSLRSIWSKIRKVSDFKGERHTCLMQEKEYLKLVSKIPEEASKPYDFKLIR
ncbi:MoaA/NifB/PqqE/SkfB family radical SAM enzyme [Methanococcoides alaskense]|uniref:MoaA/NifB/PqqE/SkfB family radical SAM enzyme n=2 Tax=Methanococcoides alaskense TaxID=325778 RepID=A0AA90TXX3_9EURY|nr:radical SAM protein [Methanococcoides alaskense]MDA0525009.1 radical SAM protein [Methanococcoides alaskense]MDR6222074.1 MoaA/NifB/PqqE/SkfB family radical SAM enzyme [Methanococcoides alaskense]